MDESMGNRKTADGAPKPEVSVGNRNTLRPESSSLGRIDQYELLRELGGGGFGVVYLARDTVAGVDVAAKGLPPLVKNNADELERIRENFALVSKLHHPRIAAALVLHPAKDVFYADEQVRQALRVTQGDTLMVMAYAPGVTLNRWRKQFSDGKVPVAQALEVCHQIAEALDYAHGEKVVHRDVKPANVMIETREASSKVRECESSKVGGTLNAERPTPNAEVVVKMLDFGLAAEIRSSMSRVSHEKGETSGTRPYMAPEQWAGKKQDGRTDQYALAVLFYELVSGAVPFASAFDTGDPVVMQGAALNLKPEPLAELPQAQNAALLRGLAKEPAERFPSCSAFVAALGGAHAETRRRSGRRVVLGLAGAAALVAVSILSVQSVRSRNARRAAAEQVARLDAAQRAKVAELTSAAEAALASGDLEAAGARIAELKGVGGRASPRAAADLQQRYESKAGERETNKRYAAASLAREEVQKMDAGQGFGEKVKALEVTWREAEAARQGQGWGLALSGYDAVIAECKRLTELDVARQSAKTQKGVAEKAKTDAESAGTPKDAEVLFADAGRAYSQAMVAFEKGEFEFASKAWTNASGKFASAQKLAAAAQGYRKAKGDFETALAADSALLKKHGGVKWDEVQRQQKVGDASADQPDKGQRAYQDALAALPDAVKEAQDVRCAEAARLVVEAKAAEENGARKKVETELLAEAQRVAVEQAKLDKIRPDYERAMAAGKEAWDTADYSTAFLSYKKALVLWPDDPAAATNFCRVDSLLNRMNPVRMAQKGDWWRKRQNVANSITISESCVTEETEEQMTIRTSSHIRGPNPAEVVSEYSIAFDGSNDFKDPKYIALTAGGMTPEQLNKNAEKKVSNKVKFGGLQEVSVGTVKYICKCIVKEEDWVSPTMSRKTQSKLWISEEAPSPLLKSITKATCTFNNRMLVAVTSTTTSQCLGFEESCLTVSNQSLKCLNVTVTHTTSSSLNKTSRTIMRIPRDYPWLMTIETETGGDVLDAFGSDSSSGGDGSATPGDNRTVAAQKRMMTKQVGRADPGRAFMAPSEGQSWVSPSTSMEFVWVPALKMWVGKYEVTNGEYRKKVPDHDSREFKGQSLNGERQPVVYVNFDDAKAYAAWLTERDGDRLGGLCYRVISENDWQVCAQCGDGREYPWGNAMPPKWGNYSDSTATRAFMNVSVNDGFTDGQAVACPVERSGANEWGLYGLGGNVWENCAADALGSSFGAWRGAHWGDDDPGTLRCAFRHAFDVSGRGLGLGFRLVLSH